MTYSVLILENDVWMQRILAKTLSGFGFKQSILANNGFEAVAKAIKEKPNLITIEINQNSNSISGVHTITMLKTIFETKNIPIMVITGLSDLETISLTFKAGAQAVISKPITRGILHNKLIEMYGKEGLSKIMNQKAQHESLNKEDEANDHILAEQIKDSLLYRLKNIEQKESNKSHDMNSIDELNSEMSDNSQNAEEKSLSSIKMLLNKTRKTSD
jgi:CheY-like chemotaxis protein